MKTNYHTHSTWCDGKDTPEDVVKAAIEKGFDAIGFSSHALLPISDPWTLQPDTVAAYVADVRAVAERYKDQIRVLCGIEADFITGVPCVSSAHTYTHSWPRIFWKRTQKSVWMYSTRWPRWMSPFA